MDVKVPDAGSLEDLLPDRDDDRPLWADDDEYEFTER